MQASMARPLFENFHLTQPYLEMRVQAIHAQAFAIDNFL
jgi:hypothetical protein